MRHRLLTTLSGAAGIPLNAIAWDLRLEADSGVYTDAGTTLATDGQTVRQWNNLGATGGNASQGTAGQRPTYRANINGMSALQFASGNRMLVGANTDFDDQAFTCFVVFDRTSGAALQALLNKGNGTSVAGSTWELMAIGSTSDVSFDTFYGSDTNNGDTSAQSYPFRDLICIKRIDATHKVIYRNGTQLDTGTDAGNNINTGSNPLGIGNSGATGALPFIGYIRGVYYIASALDDATRQGIETTLRSKWSVNTYSGDLSFYLSTFNHGDGAGPNTLYIYNTTDGKTFTAPAGVSNPVFTFPTTGGTGTSSRTAASSILYRNGIYYLAYEMDALARTQTKFGIATATSLGGTWTWQNDVTVLGAAGSVWNPRWFVDDDGSVHIIVNAEDSTGTFNTHFQPYILSAQNATFTSWSAPTAITGTSLRTNIIDVFMISPANSPTGNYVIWYKDDDTDYIEYMSSSSRASGYTITKTANWAGWGTQVEGPMLRKIGTGWRIYFDRYLLSGLSYSDSADSWATWTPKAYITAPITTGTGGIVQSI